MKVFKTRTEFWGHHSKKAGGWLGELNKSRESPFTIDEFEIVDKQEPEPVANILHTAKLMVEKPLAQLGVKNYQCYVGQGDSFRVQRSTLKEYKGKRKTMVKPVLLEEVTEYLIRRFGAEIVTHIETDDKVVMEAYRKPTHFVMGVDKDYYGQPVNFFNVDKPSEGIINCDVFGKLWRNNKGEVKGVGRSFLYWQIAAGDPSDEYKPHECSSVSWGDVSAFEALKDCTDDKEAWTALVGIFEKLYPEPKVITTWQGEQVEIDWLYVLEEMFEMARMLRFEGDRVLAVDVINHFGINL